MSPNIPTMGAPKAAPAPSVPSMLPPRPLQSTDQTLSSGGSSMLPGFQAPGMLMPPGASPMINANDLAMQGQVVADQMQNIVTSMQQVALFTGQIQSTWKSLLADTQRAKDVASGAGAGAPIPSGAEGAKVNEVNPADHRAEPSKFKRVAETAAAVEVGESVEGRREAAVVNRSPLPSVRRSAAQRRRAGEPEGGAPPAPIRGPGLGAGIGDLRSYAAQHVQRHLQSRIDEMGVHDAGRLRYGRLQALVGDIGERGVLPAISEFSPGMMSLAGPVTAAISLGALVNEQMISQRASNAVYQNIYGGTNFSTGFRNRAQEAAFAHYQTLGVLGSGEATRLFQNVSSTGIQGGYRQNALDFALNQYKKSGMSTDVSSSLIEKAVENGVTNFNGLSDSLDRVSEAAVRTGQSVAMAQQAFVQTYSRISQVTNNSAGSDTAAALTAYRVGQGRGLSTLDPTGVVTDLNQQYLSASLLGMDPQKFIAQSQTDTGLSGRAIKARLDIVRSSAINQSNMGGANDLIAEARRKNGGKPLSDEQLAEIGRSMMSSGAANMQVVQAMASAYGLGNISEAEAPEFLGRLASGDPTLDPTKPFALDTGGYTGSKLHNINGHGIRKDDAGLSGMLGGFSGNTVGDQNADLYGSVFHWKKVGGSGVTGNAASWNVDDTTKHAADAYAALMHRSGTRLAGIEKLFESDKGIGHQRVRVKTGNGTKVVSMQEAIQHYSSQLESGDAVFSGGANDGKSVGSITKVFDRGTKKAAASAAKGSLGTVTIAPTPAMEQLIKVYGSGSVTVQGAKKAGVPAPAFGSSFLDYLGATGRS